MLPVAGLESGLPTHGALSSAPRESWMLGGTGMPGAAQANAYWDALGGERTASSQSPSRYMFFRAEPESGGYLPQHASAQHATAPFFASHSGSGIYPYSAPMHPEVLQHTQRFGTEGYTLVPVPNFAMMDQSHVPMLMQLPHNSTNPGAFMMHAGEKQALLQSLGERDSVLDETWSRLRNDESAHSRDASMEELLAFSRQAQSEVGAGPNVFVCPHCEKRYTGKHARSIWRRHLQDKHAIPLAVQPRRTRWDRDANRPRNAEERRERMLESKRRWARKKREQERLAAQGLVHTKRDTPDGDEPELVSASKEDFEEPSEELVALRARSPSPRSLPTPKRSAFAPRDINVPTRLRDTMGTFKSPGNAEPKLFIPSPMPLQFTPLRESWRGAPGIGLAMSPELSGSRDPKKRSVSLRSSVKRSAMDRAALASFSRVDPSPRVFVPSATKRDEPRTYTDLQGSPTAHSFKSRDGRSGDQFSSPQHLGLTQSLGLAPHSASKQGVSPMYGGISMTPTAGGITPYSKMPFGLTPTIGGLLRAGHDGMGSVPPSAGDLSASGYMMGFAALDTPSDLVRRSSIQRHGRAETSFHSSSERDEEEEEPESEFQRNASPSIRQRPRVPRLPAHETPSKQRSNHRTPARASGVGTPRSPWQRTSHSSRASRIR
ncbi:hypothetical protein MVES1_000505 [Malassezia vespertilionis]|uniref:Uncharacterized protein n=1 Tax=Malassezia vespertilionis TaxID=2020962 RepID=A0A2N1JG91_9BASI|nr:uncharacterized protein MVES1_000505 [Malassezia vespertilionis]PKI85563.1 hypothetical protein MVES_000466 [Malassezia vespertilionis]WFD05179.1 hypothetical protein MVES1_000505 [Malassezia vespertilionis]